MATSPTVHGGYPNINYSGNGNQQNQPFGGGVFGNSLGYTYTVGNGLSAADLANVGNVTLTMSPKFSTMNWAPMDKGEVDITFHEEEAGVWVKAVLAPAYDMTPRESMNIQLLITGIVYGAMAKAMTQTKPLTFIRKHNLERHFNISLA
jgi:hypothetical protein